jgi:hypothetical protein
VWAAHNEHHLAFADLIELMHETIERLGVRVERTMNELVTDRLNVLVGTAYLYDAATVERIARSGARYVVFQSEILDAREGFALVPAYLELLRGAVQVWDYSQVQVDILRRLGIGQARHVPVGWARRLERVVRGTGGEKIDVFFYGAAPPRRFDMLESLWQRGVKVKPVFGVYGTERDEMIGRAKIVLNVHQFEVPRLEQVRLAYLLNNKVFVVSERSEEEAMYGDGVVFCEYGELVDCCVRYLEMEEERRRVTEAGYAAIKRVEMEGRMRAALLEMGMHL